MTPPRQTDETGPLQDSGVKRLIKSGADYLSALAQEMKEVREARAEAVRQAEEMAAERTANPPEGLEGPPYRDRAAVIASCDLGPHSLVGSWFFAVEDGEATMMGLIVGEVQPPSQPVSGYLLQLYRSGPSGMLDQKTRQVLMPVVKMLGQGDEAKDRMGLSHEAQVEWSFYDTEDQLKEAWFTYFSETAREQV